MLKAEELGNGQEQSEKYKDYKRREFVQYDYRASDGQLFSTVATKLSEARNKRDEWIRATFTNEAREKEFYTAKRAATVVCWRERGWI